ncbi:MAG TPA: carbon-nitrogen hydrolase [Burkholderiales bacterium]|nr:carbon-nitrogen hydrolase [Burkholderiales bacterium]
MAEARRVAVVQMAMSERPEDNVARAHAMAARAVDEGARLVCLPELFRTRYFCQTEDAANFALAEPVPGPTTEAFRELAARSGATLVLSLFERRAAGLYHNTAAVLDGAKGYVGKYRKMHIPDDPRYYEKFYFTPGDLGFRAFDTHAGPVGVLVCWDQWYPEAARLTALAGADVLLYPTAIGWHPEEQDKLGARQHAAWETIQRSHAIANGCFVMVANRTGFEPDPTGRGGIRFWGQSFIAGTDGRLLATAGPDEETVLVADLDPAEIAESRIGWPFLRDRRIDAYDDLRLRFLDPDRRS